MMLPPKYFYSLNCSALKKKSDIFTETKCLINCEQMPTSSSVTCTVPCHHLSCMSHSLFVFSKILSQNILSPPSQSACLQCKNVGIGVIPSWHIPSLLSSWAAGSICVEGARERGRGGGRRRREKERKETGEEAERREAEGSRIRRRREVRHKLIWQTALNHKQKLVWLMCWF